MVLEESLTVLAELDAEHMQRQYGSHGSFPIAHAPETDCAKVKSGDRSVIFQPLVGHAVALAPKVEGARRCAGDSIISFQVFWYYSSFLHRVLFWYKPCTGT